MTDRLRDKIAKVLCEHRLGRSVVPDHDPGYICECGWRSEPDCTWTDHPEHVADAVIRELNIDISHYYKTSQGREVCIEGFWTEEATDE